jgi:hypothetical protein
MFGSATIDIAIGMVFVFLLLSLIASTINEIILSFLSMRGKELLRGLKMLLDDTNATGLVAKVYNHGQIFGLFEGEFDPKKPGKLPSYIPPENFVMALLDVVPEHAAQPGALQAPLSAGAPVPVSPPSVAAAAAGAGVGDSTPPPTIPPPARSPSSGDLFAQLGRAQQDATAMLTSLRTSAQKLAANPATEKVGKPLVSMIDAAGGDVAKLKQSLTDWYNSAMDRVSGWYKYRTQWMLFWIGLVLAMALNADAVRIVKQLSTDSTLRQSIVAAAQSAKQPDGQGAQPIANQIDQARQQVSAIQNLGIPLGWTNPLQQNRQEALADAFWSTPNVASEGLLQVLFGWLLTAVAVSLGAPFWFDMLNKIMVVRSTVKPRENSQEEASKEPQQPQKAQSGG